MEQKTNKRIWELDAIRGAAFLFMAIDHFAYDLAFLFEFMWPSEANRPFMAAIIKVAADYRISDFWEIFRIVFIAGVFLTVSGIVSNFSRSNLKRGLRLGIVALLLTFGTFLASLGDMSNSVIIYFGILHCLATAMLLTPLFKKFPNWALLFFGLAIIGIGTYLSIKDFTGPGFLIPFNITPSYFATADYYPLFPFLGFYVLGILLGRTVYKQKISLFEKEWNIRPLNYLGRNALVFYFLHQAILIGFIFLLGFVLSNF